MIYSQLAPAEMNCQYCSIHLGKRTVAKAHPRKSFGSYPFANQECIIMTKEMAWGRGGTCLQVAFRPTGRAFYFQVSGCHSDAAGWTRGAFRLQSAV